MPCTIEDRPEVEIATEPQRSGPASSRPRARSGWKRAGCWLVIGGLFIGVAALIDPQDSPASERLVPRLPMPELASGLAGSAGERALSADGLDSLGSLEGLDTTVWFYAGIRGPLASLYAADREPIEQVTLEELYRLAPELRLETGIATMGDVPVPIDDSVLDW